MTAQPLMILIAGPYRSGTRDDPVLMERNLRTLEAAALPLYRAGDIPVIGEWLALSLLREAGSTRPGDAIYDEILYQIANRLLARCDGVLRLPGASKGADEDVRLANDRGLLVWHSVAEVPGCGTRRDNYSKTPMSPRTNLNCYAARTAAGAGPGSHGSGIKGTNRVICSDPQSPQRCLAEVETVWQFSQ
jgi:hypothetical protein